MNIMKSMVAKIRREVSDRELFKREVSEGCKLYPGYGVAYHDYLRCVAVCYPVPLHLVVRLWHWFVFWWYRRIIKVDWWATPFDLFSKAGKESPYQTGYSRGYNSARFEFDNGIQSIEGLRSFKIKAEQIKRAAFQEGREKAYKEMEENLDQYVKENKERALFKKQAD